MPRKRVLLIDDHPIVMQGIRDLLSQSGLFDIVGECQTGPEGLTAARRHQPDLIVLDLRIGDQLAPDLCGPLKTAVPNVNIVIFTAFDDEDILLACQRNGVASILLKDTYGVNLVKAFCDVCDGKSIIDPRIASRRLERVHPHWGEDDEAFERLTDREYQVLRLLARGMTSREIADDLGLAMNTVRSYTQEVLGKLRSTNRVQAVATARRLHLI